MKFICLGYLDEAFWKSLSFDDAKEFVDRCLAYDDELVRNGCHRGGEALQSAENAVTVRWKNGQPAVTDGPFAETKEQIGGILILEARDLNHAISLMSKHPGVRAGGFEIRQVDEEFEALIAERLKKARGDRD